MPWFNDVHAILIGLFGGMEMGNAVARIIAGDDDPGGRLPVVYPVRLEDSPAMRDYAPVDGVQRYTEGEWYGWRGQAQNGVDPLIPFGFGLSYGESVWGAPRVTVDRSWPRCEVVVPVSCVSSRPATEVVQCYVRRAGDSNPPRLAGWSKRLVQPSSFADIPVQIPWASDMAGPGWQVGDSGCDVEPRHSHVAHRRNRRMRIGPFARLGSTTFPPWVICTFPFATSLRAAIRVGSINDCHDSPPT
jgi:beta-glucosidase